jgi:hypothetical protein
MANWGGNFIEFFSFISSQAKPVTENEAKKKGNKSEDDTLLHWLFPVTTFLIGFWISGEF